MATMMERHVAETIMAFAHGSRQRATKEQARAIRLADAAPDLLNVLKRLVKARTSIDFNEIANLVVLAEAAIAKATGKEA